MTVPARDSVDFFVSYAGADRPWAEWVAWQLQAAGYTVVLDMWDWAPGDNVMLCISDALAKADRVVALYSPAYFDPSRFTTDEWTAVLSRRRRLVPVRVAEVEPPDVLAPLLYADVFGVPEVRAREVLLTAVGAVDRRPVTPPRFPGGPDGGPRVPGSLPAVWNVPHRNRSFTGREAVLAELRQRLLAGERALVQALRGMGGVGKTQVAIEYARLFAGEYDLVWWVDAERSELIGEQVAALAVRAGWVGREAPVRVGVDAATDGLRQRVRWLVVFDNVQVPADVRDWLPPGAGHVVITSRSGGFQGLAATVEVDVFSRDESVALLRDQVPALVLADADRVADAVGDLPLALAQAAGILADTGMTADEYLGELGAHADEVLAAGAPVDYPVPLAATIGVSMDRLAAGDPAAVQLVELCAALAPEPIPVSWLRHAPEGVLQQPLANVVGRDLALRQCLGRVADLGLARVTGDTVQVHRLIQAVLRQRQVPADRDAEHRRAQALVAAAEPDNDGSDPGSWPAWAALLPHLLYLDPTTAEAPLRQTACNALWYLLMRGEYQTASPLATAWHQHWRATLDGDHEHVLWAANQLATAHYFLGHPERARELFEEVFTRSRRTLGDDHPNTLGAASNLATQLRSLGTHEEARRLDEDTLARFRRVLGEDHPDTLRSANNLAVDLRLLGEYEQARRLDEDTLVRRRRVLGDDHPDTVRSASNLAVDLSTLGEHDRARRLDEDTLLRRRRVLGDDHPDTKHSAGHLAENLRALGQHERAPQVEETFGVSG